MTNKTLQKNIMSSQSTPPSSRTPLPPTSYQLTPPYQLPAKKLQANSGFTRALTLLLRSLVPLYVVKNLMSGSEFKVREKDYDPRTRTAKLVRGFTRAPTLALLHSCFQSSINKFQKYLRSFRVTTCSSDGNKNTMPKLVRGFTLLELLLYITISSTILLVVSLFLSTLLQSRIKNQTIAEVEQQGLLVMQIITQTIRNAEAVNSPTIGTSASSLSLDVVDVADDPTVFDVSANTFRITEGTGGAVVLTNDRVSVLNPTFENLSRTGTVGTIRIEFTINHVNPSEKFEYDYQKTFYGSASLR